MEAGIYDFAISKNIELPFFLVIKVFVILIIVTNFLIVFLRLFL